MRAVAPAAGASAEGLADLCRQAARLPVWRIRMRVLVANPPWPGPGYGARSDVRWPHKRSDKYIEYPIYLAYTVAVVEQAGWRWRLSTPSWTS